ncbi:MAG: prophage regulatory protein [Marinobacter sp. T13-3]|nr:MAG: prophage regulatory protein [Marinobacter sp. T13-3]
MSDKFLRLPAVMEKVGLRRTAIYDKISTGDFPQPIKLGNVSVWLESEVNGWAEENGITPEVLAAIQDKHDAGDKHQLIFDEQSRALTGRSIRSVNEIVTAAKRGTDTKVSGVYFLVKGGEVVYVGQSTSVYSRVTTHYASKDFDFWSYIPCEKEGLDILESLYIHFLQPKLNGKTGQTDQLSAPISLDDLLKRVTLKEAA